MPECDLICTPENTSGAQNDVTQTNIEAKFHMTPKFNNMKTLSALKSKSKKKKKVHLPPVIQWCL